MLHALHTLCDTLHSQIVCHADDVLHHRTLSLVRLHIFIPEKALINLQHFKRHIADQAQR